MNQAASSVIQCTCIILALLRRINDTAVCVFFFCDSMLSSNLRKLFGLSRARPTHKAQLGAAAFCIALVLRLRMDISLSHWFSPLPIPMARRIHCLQRIGYRVSCDYTQVSLLDAQACTMFTQQGIIALPALSASVMAYLLCGLCAVCSPKRRSCIVKVP